jgi:hypothetical protein
MHVCVSTVVTDGAFAPDGSFIPLPKVEAEPFEKLWQRKVFDLLLERGKIDEPLVRQMLCWQHSGFAVSFAVQVGPDDVAGRERLLQYMLRCPFSLQRVIRVTPEGQVLYRAENKEPRHFPKPASPDLFGGVARRSARRLSTGNFQLFDPLDFIAELTQHIPDARKHLVRSFGWYSCKTRGLRAKADPRHGDTVTIDDAHAPRPRQARRRWAALIKQVWRVAPLICARCGARMMSRPLRGRRIPARLSRAEGTAEHVVEQALAAGDVVGAEPHLEIHGETAVAPAGHLAHERLVDLAALQEQVEDLLLPDFGEAQSSRASRRARCRVREAG